MSVKLVNNSVNIAPPAVELNPVQENNLEQNQAAAAAAKVADIGAAIIENPPARQDENLLVALSSPDFLKNRILATNNGLVEAVAKIKIDDSNVRGLNLSQMKTNLEALKKGMLELNLNVYEQPMIEQLLDQTIYTVKSWKEHLEKSGELSVEQVQAKPEAVQNNTNPTTTEEAVPELSIKDKYVANLHIFFNVLKSNPILAYDSTIKIEEKNENEATFTMTFPFKLQGEITRLNIDHNGRKLGFEPAEGATVLVERELKGTINYQTGKMTFEGNGLTVVKGISHTVHEVTIKEEGGFVFKRSGLLPVTQTFDLETMFQTLSAVTWADGRTAKPPRTTSFKNVAQLALDEFFGKLVKLFLKKKERPKDLDEQTLLKALATKNLSQLNIVARKNGEVRLLENSWSALSMERKMVRGAETLAELKFDNVKGIDVIAARTNLESLRQRMYQKAATQEGADRIWEAMTRAINTLGRERPPSLASRIVTRGARLVGDYAVAPVISTVCSVAKATWANRWQIAATAAGAALISFL